MWWSWPCGSIALDLLTGHSVYKSIRSSILSHDSCHDLITAANKLGQFRQTRPRLLRTRANRHYLWILRVTGRGRGDELEGAPPQLLSPWCREPSREGWRSSRWSVRESRKLPGTWWAGGDSRDHTPKRVQHAIRCCSCLTKETFQSSIRVEMTLRDTGILNSALHFHQGVTNIIYL